MGGLGSTVSNTGNAVGGTVAGVGNAVGGTVNGVTGAVGNTVGSVTGGLTRQYVRHLVHEKHLAVDAAFRHRRPRGCSVQARTG